MAEQHHWYAVRNAEGQYSVWRNHMPVPAGWEVVHQADDKDACLAYIGRTWTDIRPVSCR
nr:MbtH family NRPS accessory protein [Streptomyces sp. NBC_00857]